MPKGVKRKPDVVKAGETFRVGAPDQAASDDLTNVDKGIDFVKTGETAQVGH